MTEAELLNRTRLALERENEQLRAVLRECRDWLEAPGGEPDRKDLLRLINTNVA